MKCDQKTIDTVTAVYNEVTKAHKRPPVVAYIQSRIEKGETAEIVSGHPRWSSALQFSGTVDDMHVVFVINDSLPESFQNLLAKTKLAFEDSLKKAINEL